MSSQDFAGKDTLTISKLAEPNKINELLKSNNIPSVSKKSLFNPVYKGTKGALGQINGFFARRHRLCGGTIITVTHGEIAEETGYASRTAQRIIKKLEAMGRLIVLRGWKNSYLYLPENIGIESWLENFKLKFGLDLRTQMWVDTGQNVVNPEPESIRHNVVNNTTECREDDLSYKESFKESKTDLPEKPPENPPPETDLDRIKDAAPKVCYRIKNLDEKIKESIKRNGFEYTLWAAKESHDGNIKYRLFEDMMKNGKAKYDKFEKQRTRKAEAEAIQESREHQKEIEFMAKVFKPFAFKECEIDFHAKKSTFLKALSSTKVLFDRFSNMTDTQLKATNEFRNFKA
jgi:hypothetical protein